MHKYFDHALTGLLLATAACGRTDAVVVGADDYGGGDTFYVETGDDETSTEAGDGDGDWGEEGDGDPWGEEGDGDPWGGDGDGDPWGEEGDGDPWGGDGDGDPWGGDGDGDPWGGDGDGDGDPWGGDGDGDGDVCGDGVVTGGEVCDDGVNDGSYDGCNADCLSFAAYCGDGVQNGPEDCDDQDADSTDGCLGDCTIPTSCADILAYDAMAPSGAYLISPKPATPWTTTCDMTTDGGGWTAITVEHTCNGDLDSVITPVQAAVTEGVDMMCRPFTADGPGNHTYYWDIEFPPGLDAFYIGSDYLIRANSSGPGNNTSEISFNDFVQSDWNAAYSGWHGDVSFGSGDEPGPVTSYAAEGTDVSCVNCQQSFPNPDSPYALAMTTTALRIGWGEGGGQNEGWYPWFDGTIYVR